MLIDLADAGARGRGDHRPARPARRSALGGLDEVGDAIGDAGRELFVFGQYGNERWSSTNRRVDLAAAAAGLAAFLRELPRVLRSGRTRPTPSSRRRASRSPCTPGGSTTPTAAFERLLPPLGELAERHGLTVEPGRNVIEVRSPGMHKGPVVETWSRSSRPAASCSPATTSATSRPSRPSASCARSGLPTLLVCSASREENALRDLADVVVDGPAGVLDLLRRLTSDATSDSLTTSRA